MLEIIGFLRALKAVEYSAGKLSEIIDAAGQGLDDQIKKRLNKLSYLRDTTIKCVKDGLLDSLLCEFYKDSQNSDYSLYTSRFFSEQKCAFAHKANWVSLYCDLTTKNHFEYCGESKVEQQYGLSAKELYVELEAAEQFGIKQWDAPIYALKSIVQNGQNLNFKIVLSKYYKHKFTMGRMQEENLLALQIPFGKEKFERNAKEDEIPGIIQDKNNKMPVRSSLNGIPNLGALDNYGERITPTGVNVLFAMRRDKSWNDDYALIIQKRTLSVSEGPSTLTVIPTGIHQPMVNPKAEVDITSTIWREIYEELFQGEEATKNTTHLVPGWYKKESNLIAEMSGVGASRVFLTAFGFNLHTYFFDFCVLVIINDSQYWRNNWHTLKGNWEMDESITPIVSSKDYDQIISSIGRKDWSPGSRVAFEQGIIALQKYDSERVKLG